MGDIADVAKIVSTVSNHPLNGFKSSVRLQVCPADIRIVAYPTSVA